MAILRRPRRDGEALPSTEQWNHYHEIVQPLTAALRASVPGMSAEEFPCQLANVPLGYAAVGGRTVISLPPSLHLSREVKGLIREIVCARLGLDGPSVSWREQGQWPSVAFTVPELAPTAAPFSEVRGHMDRAPETAPVIGIAARGRIVDADWCDDSPNLLISSGAGGGKTVLGRSIVCQGLRHGAGVVCIDIKRSSHTWLLHPEPLPGVLYCRDLGEIHAALLALSAEADRRNRVADDPHADVGPRIYLLFEEMTATMFRLATWWGEVRSKEDPKTCPSVSAFRDLIYMGRSAKVTTIAIAQMASARSLGGPEVRESFSVRCLSAARTSIQAWRMLAPEVTPIPRKVKGAGRWQVVKNGEAYETTGIWITDQEAREYALSGGGWLDVSVLGSQADTLVLPAPRVSDGVTLRRALELDPELAPTLDALRKCSQRPGFPESTGSRGNASLYDPGELGEWRRRRNAIRAVGSA